MQNQVVSVGLAHPQSFARIVAARTGQRVRLEAVKFIAKELLRGKFPFLEEGGLARRRHHPGCPKPVRARTTKAECAMPREMHSRRVTSLWWHLTWSLRSGRHRCISSFTSLAAWIHMRMPDSVCAWSKNVL